MLWREPISVLWQKRRRKENSVTEVIGSKLSADGNAKDCIQKMF
jgi:hypothetical protein